MKIEMTDEILHNLIIFLNRVDYKGLDEVQAINQIMLVLKPNQNEEVQRLK